MANPKKTESLLADGGGKPMLTDQQANLADLAAITGGEAPSEAEHNLVVTKVNAILDVLEAHGLMADS